MLLLLSTKSPTITTCTRRPTRSCSFLSSPSVHYSFLYCSGSHDRNFTVRRSRSNCSRKPQKPATIRSSFRPNDPSAIASSVTRLRLKHFTSSAETTRAGFIFAPSWRTPMVACNMKTRFNFYITIINTIPYHCSIHAHIHNIL